ncbi:hypothetical protein AAE478_004968 [Parahypoxylon ruwenzoriense]
MSYNRIAVYGHRGWASSAIVNALISSSAPIKVLYRPGSDVSSLPSGVSKVEVDVENRQQLIDALRDIDIVISLVGHEGVERQHAFIKAMPNTDVKLFVPSELGMRAHDEQGRRVPLMKAKEGVQQVAKAAGIRTTAILVGCLIEPAFAGILGVDYLGNRIIFTGDKFKATGQEIFSALEKKYGTSPQKFTHSLEKVENEIQACIKVGNRPTLAWWCRKAWGNGTSVKSVGEDIWEVEGYKKTNITELVVDGKLESYKDLPPPLVSLLNDTFH